jgi:cell division protein FtsL
MEENKKTVNANESNQDENKSSSAASSPKKTSKRERPVLDVINGNFLTNATTIKQIPFLLFLVLVAIIYISNTYYAEKIMRKTNTVNNEIKELRSEYITSKSDLMFISKQSEVARAAEEMKIGIKESVVAPKKIVIEKGELVTKQISDSVSKITAAK